jgi:hypothetical protein
MIKMKSLISEGSGDEYYYHATLAPNVLNISRTGLFPNKKATITNYREYSKNKIFLCDSEALPYWISKIGEHGFHNYDDEKYHAVAVFRIQKSNLIDVQIDREGQSDCKRGNSYFVTRPVPPEQLEFVEIIEDAY